MKGKTIRILTLIIFGIIVTGAFYTLLYLKTIEFYAESEEINMRLSQSEAKNRELDVIRKDIKSTLADNEKIQQVFVARDAVVDFIQNLEFFGKEIGVEVDIKNVKNAELVPESLEKESLIVSVSAFGSKERVTAFLRLMENLPYKINFEKVSLSKAPMSESADPNAVKLPVKWELAVDINAIKFK